MLWLLGELDGWIKRQPFHIWIGILSKKYGNCDRMKERGPPLGSGPHLGEASRSGSKQFPLQRPHQGKHQLSARAGGGGRGDEVLISIIGHLNVSTAAQPAACESCVVHSFYGTINMNIKPDQWNVIICGKCTLEEKQFVSLKKCFNLVFWKADIAIVWHCNCKIVAKNKIYRCGT